MTFSAQISRCRFHLWPLWPLIFLSLVEIWVLVYAPFYPVIAREWASGTSSLADFELWFVGARLMSKFGFRNPIRGAPSLRLLTLNHTLCALAVSVYCDSLRSYMCVYERVLTAGFGALLRRCSINEHVWIQEPPYAALRVCLHWTIPGGHSLSQSITIPYSQTCAYTTLSIANQTVTFSWIAYVAEFEAILKWKTRSQG